jgi:hemolysin activation/secretion protein
MHHQIVCARLALIGAFIGCFALNQMAMAQSNIRPPDAGALQRQIERERFTPWVPRNGLSGPDTEVRPTDSQDTTMVFVRRFLFQGNTLLSSEVLTQLLKDSTLQNLTTNQLYAAAEKVRQAYTDAGLMADVSLPNQDVTQGDIRFKIIEATLGEVVFMGEPPSQIRQDHIRKIFNAHLSPGEIFSVQPVERALLVAQELPGMSIKHHIGQWISDTSPRNMYLDVTSLPTHSADIILDNAGARSTGRERAWTNFKVSNALGLGEQSIFSLLKTDGSTYLRGETSWPLGYRGWRLSLYDAHLSYRLVAPEFVATRAQGTSNTLGLSVTYPLKLTSYQSLLVNFQAERKGFDNQSNGATESQYKSTALGAGLTFNAKDDLNQVSKASLQWLQGQLNLNGSPTQSRDAAGAQTAGRFGKWQYSLSRLRPLGSHWEAYAAFNGQWANKNLDSSEKFTLGGEGGVRAYPGSEGVGAQGKVANLELRWRATNADTLVGFYDWGQVTLLRDNPSATALNAYALKGAGLGWILQMPDNSRIKFSWARRIGNNPNPSNTGTDQDGSLIRNRYWLSASVPFAL